LGSRERSAFTSRDVTFDEKTMLREKSETEDKAQGGASDNLTDTQEKEVEFSETLKGLKVRRGLLRFRWRRPGGYTRAT